MQGLLSVLPAAFTAVVTAWHCESIHLYCLRMHSSFPGEWIFVCPPPRSQCQFLQLSKFLFFFVLFFFFFVLFFFACFFFFFLPFVNILKSCNLLYMAIVSQYLARDILWPCINSKMKKTQIYDRINF